MYTNTNFYTFSTYDEECEFYHDACKWGNTIRIEEPMHMVYNGLELGSEYWEVVVYTCI